MCRGEVVPPTAPGASVGFRQLLSSHRRQTDPDRPWTGGARPGGSSGKVTGTEVGRAQDPFWTRRDPIAPLAICLPAT